MEVAVGISSTWRALQHPMKVKQIPLRSRIGRLDKVIKKTNYHFEYIDLGGGMGIDYENNNKKLNLRKYSLIVKRFKEKHKTKIIFDLECNFVKTYLI